jgi:hypothetical protein
LHYLPAAEPAPPLFGMVDTEGCGFLHGAEFLDWHSYHKMPPGLDKCNVAKSEADKLRDEVKSKGLVTKAGPGAILELPCKSDGGHGFNPGVCPPRGTGNDWWFDMNTPCGPTSVGKKAVWRTGARPLTDRSKLRGTAHIWEVQSASRGHWYPIHTDKRFLARIEEIYVSGQQYLPYAEQYAKPNPDNHRYVIDFEHMKQIDVFFPCDPTTSHGPFNVRRRAL